VQCGAQNGSGKSVECPAVCVCVQAWGHCSVAVSGVVQGGVWAVQACKVGRCGNLCVKCGVVWLCVCVCVCAR